MASLKKKFYFKIITCHFYRKLPHVTNVQIVRRPANCLAKAVKQKNNKTPRGSSP